MARQINLDRPEKSHRLKDFVNWTKQHINGDEKGEAQIFLDHLFQAFGHPGLREVGATCEQRIKLDRRGTAFADLVWKPVVLIEMKRRGEDLSRHYRQAFDYWTRLVPNRPRYVVLCNFDEFWVYDFETQMDTPVDRVHLDELPARFGPLAFLFPTGEKPVFGNDQQTVTRQAADILATCFNLLLARKVDRDLAQRFILQSLVTLFAEDIGLLDKYFFARLLDECKRPADTYDLIGGLFTEMNTPGVTEGGRFRGVAYFNGGLFKNPARLELNGEEIELVRQAARFDWSRVRPEIFGTLFEHSLEKEERHAFGAHFTHPTDIMKIVGPTIVEPWRNYIEGAASLKELRGLLARIENFKVLDPACGSGNFLYIAYREIKRLEARIYERMADEYKSVNPYQRPFGFVSTGNFYGLDINSFAVELAKVTMMLAHKLAIDELHINEPALPFDNLNANFQAIDALIDNDGQRTVWPDADVIIGNPPFLGAKRLKPERGVEYVNALRALYPEVPGMADYCVYWIRRAHEHLAAATVNDPFAGRAGLVGTQNIRNNQSRVGGLDYVTQSGGTIVEAVDNQPWSGEANVHVSIVNWAKTQDRKLLPDKPRLWFKLEARRVDGRRAHGAGSAAKDYELSFREVAHINSALSDGANVSEAQILRCNTDPQRVFQGVTPGHKGFVLEPEERDALLKQAPQSAEVIHPYLIGDEILAGAPGPMRYLIDFEQRDLLEVQAFGAAFEHVRNNVLPDVERKANEEHKEELARKAHLGRWWLLWRSRAEMVRAYSKLSRYLCCSRITKRPIFVFVAATIRPGDALQVFALEDDYSFGILQSAYHWEWFIAKCSKMKSDFRYTPESVFDTFPWPQNPSQEHVEAVVDAARKVSEVRTKATRTVKGGLRGLYRTLDLPGENPLRDAHMTLDEAVREAYGFSKDRNSLTQLLELNLDLARKLDKGADVSGPGVPASYRNAGALTSSDCIGCTGARTT